MSDETTGNKTTDELKVAPWQRPGFGRKVAICAAVLAVLILALIWHIWGRVTTEDAEVDGHVMTVSSKIYGNIIQVMVADNQPVKSGDVLARIDPRDYEVKVAQAQAALDLAVAQAKAAGVGVPLSDQTTMSTAAGAADAVTMADADAQRARLGYEQVSEHELRAAQAAVAAREAANSKAQADLSRMKPLAAKTEISHQQFDAYKAAADIAVDELTAAREKLAATRKESEQRHESYLAANARLQQAKAQLAGARAGRQQVQIQSAQAEAARAAVEQARANLANAELQLSYTEIKAPSDGIVTRKSVEVGQVVQPGQGLLMVVPLSETWVTANFKETQLKHVRAGQKAIVKVDMYGVSFTGHVDSLSSATGAKLSLLPPENATGNFVKVVQRIPIKIVLDPVPADKAVLRPGMNVEATIVTR
jgi:membrane fusion protein (multidrug efflux system)